MSAASAAATKATVSATRVPKIRRESTSRPRSSVPRRNAEVPPSTPKGGRLPDIRSCSSGSCGAMTGARIAARRSRRMKPPPARTFGSRKSAARAWPSRRRVAAAGRGRAISSATIEARVQGDDAKVDREIDENEERAEDEHQPLDQRLVAVDHRVDRHIADAGISEDALDDHRAADQEGELHAGQSE